MQKYLHINPSVIDSLCPGVNPVLISVLQAYLEVRQADLTLLDQAVITGQSEQQRQYAHRMKSQFRLLGVDNAASLCLQLEQAEQTSIEQSTALLAEVVELEQLVAAEVSDLIIELTTEPATQAGSS